jgi:lysophospholipase L1-like esterase
MRNHRRFAAAVLGLFVLGLGCAQDMRVQRAGESGGRTAVEREQLIKPGQFGDGAAADRRRGFFDFWNEQVIREDRAVSTVFMGDSITELWNIPVYLESRYGLIQNRGISGDLASHMARRFEADVVQLRPRNVVILAGTNDVRVLVEAGKSDEEVVGEITASIESMIDQARAAGINTLVCSILPTNSDYRLHDQRTYLRARINERVKAACAVKGCIYVDYAAEMSDEAGDLRKDLARDGLHPHYAGYEIMTRVLQATARANGMRL